MGGGSGVNHAGDHVEVVPDGVFGARILVRYVAEDGDGTRKGLGVPHLRGGRLCGAAGNGAHEAESEGDEDSALKQGSEHHLVCVRVVSFSVRGRSLRIS